MATSSMQRKNPSLFFTSEIPIPMIVEQLQHHHDEESDKNGNIAAVVNNRSKGELIEKGNRSGSSIVKPAVVVDWKQIEQKRLF